VTVSQASRIAATPALTRRLCCALKLFGLSLRTTPALARRLCDAVK
jgi:hypothetical protein